MRFNFLLLALSITVISIPLAYLLQRLLFGEAGKLRRTKPHELKAGSSREFEDAKIIKFERLDRYFTHYYGGISQEEMNKRLAKYK